MAKKAGSEYFSVWHEFRSSLRSANLGLLILAAQMFPPSALFLRAAGQAEVLERKIILAVPYLLRENAVLTRFGSAIPKLFPRVFGTHSIGHYLIFFVFVFSFDFPSFPELPTEGFFVPISTSPLSAANWHSMATLFSDRLRDITLHVSFLKQFSQGPPFYCL